MGYQRIGIVLLLTVQMLCAQTADPLSKAYEALKLKDYPRAIDNLQQAIALTPDRPAIHTDLAYTLLKIGESEAARDQFAEAMRLNPADDHVALEYAFLCYETKQEVAARRTFEKLAVAGPRSL
jgi:Tfp pilus assembly protein PilF